MKRILILMSDTGGGHRASAEALWDALQERHGNELHIDMVDLLVRTARVPVRRMSMGYRFLVDDAPWLWKLLYSVGEQPQALRLLLSSAARLFSRSVSRVIRRYDPDLIVSVHPLMQDVVLRILRRMKRDTPFVTVVTDLITIPLVWFDAAVALCFVPSDAAYQRALRAGLRPEQLRLHGLPIRPAFGRPPRAKAVLREELALRPGVPAAVLISGGEGMGPVRDIALAVARRLEADSEGSGPPAGQLVVICGRNEGLQRDLETESWPIPTIVKGYVESIWEWMAACDCVISKAGPGTIAESLALGLPLVLTGYIPGQESGNVPYVLKHGVGVYVEEPEMIAEVVSGWFGPEREAMEQMAARARKVGRPQATFQIADDIAALLPPASQE